MTPPIVPNSNQPLVDSRGMVTQIWQRFFNAIIGPAGAVSAITVGASPFTFTASQRGSVAISGGTLTSVVLNRAGTSISLGTGRTAPVAPGDTVTVTYSVLPTMTFVPL